MNTYILKRRCENLVDLSRNVMIMILSHPNLTFRVTNDHSNNRLCWCVNIQVYLYSCITYLGTQTITSSKNDPCLCLWLLIMVLFFFFPHKTDGGISQGIFKNQSKNESEFKFKYFFYVTWLDTIKFFSFYTEL